MNTSKKWMISFVGDNYEWVKGINDETDIGGSEIINELINRVRRDKTQAEEFKQGLLAAKTRLKLEELEGKKQDLEDQIRQLSTKVVRSGNHVKV